MATTDQTNDRAIDFFFNKELVELANRLKRGGRSFLAAGVDPKADSYYITRRRRTMTRSDFESAGCRSPDSFPDDLTRLWKGEGREDLLSLIPGLAKLARGLYNLQDQSDEVSPFVYVMY
jgi:hypothetical protein